MVNDPQWTFVHLGCRSNLLIRRAFRSSFSKRRKRVTPVNKFTSSAVLGIVSR